MGSIARTAGADIDAWGRDDEKRFDKAVADEKRAQSLLDFETGHSDVEDRLRAKIARLSRQKFEQRESVLVESPELRDARSELERLESIMFTVKQAPIEALDLERTSDDALRTAAMSLVEAEQNHLSAKQLDYVDGLLRGSQPVRPELAAQRIVATGTKAYVSGFCKRSSAFTPILDRAEQAALIRIGELRGVSESGSGTYGVPWFIDASIVPVAGEMQAPLIDMATHITMGPTAAFWNGLGSPSAPVYAYVAEGAAMADNSVTLTGPQIPIVAAKANMVASYEIFEDLEGGFTQRLQDLLAVGYRDLLGTGTITGSGTGANPLGALTQLVNTTTNNAHVTCTTAGTFTAVDARAAWDVLPGRFRDNSTWLMNQKTLGVVRGWSTDGKGTSGGLALSDYAETSNGPTLMGRPIRTSESFPAFTGTTGAANICAVGDWSQFYYITRLGGQTLDLVPNLFSTTTGMPTMQRALVSVIRHGYQLIDPRVAVLVSNT